MGVFNWKGVEVKLLSMGEKTAKVQYGNAAPVRVKIKTDGSLGGGKYINPVWWLRVYLRDFVEAD